MGVLTDWVRNLILMTSAISFAEILLPSGSMGRYVKFILALILLAVLVHPLTNLGQSEQPVFTGETYTSDGELKEVDPAVLRLQTIQTNQIRQVYEDRLANMMEETEGVTKK